MNLKQMEYFVAIVNEGNISAAAKSLHISQPPLSAQMKLLEDEMGVVLFERGSRSIFLTEAGKVFYEKALHILHLTTAVSDELQQIKRTSASWNDLFSPDSQVDPGTLLFCQSSSGGDPSHQ